MMTGTKAGERSAAAAEEACRPPPPPPRPSRSLNSKERASTRMSRAGESSVGEDEAGMMHHDAKERGGTKRSPTGSRSLRGRADTRHTVAFITLERKRKQASKQAIRRIRRTGRTKRGFKTKIDSPSELLQKLRINERETRDRAPNK